jgi:hypothetical protein
MERRAAWCAFSVVNIPPNCRTKIGQIAERKPAKLPNENRPNCRMKIGQIAEQKPAKLPNENRPNCRIENFLLYLCLKTKYIVAYEKGVST